MSSIKELHIKSISDVNEFLQLGKPLHPLITVFFGGCAFDNLPQVGKGVEDIKFINDLYFISMNGTQAGAFNYGNNSYGYDTDSVTFIGPNQVFNFPINYKDPNEERWGLIFHPDLIREHTLGSEIKQYTFFDYTSNEALILDINGKKVLRGLMNKIFIELNQTFDKHTEDIIVQNLGSIFKYSNRYYEAQFQERSESNSYFLRELELYLETYFNSEELREKGLPSIKKCGEAMNLSGSYLSDLLKKETGKSIKDHIYDKFLDEAKNLLLSSGNSISEIGYKFGFQYPQHFSGLFKLKSGVSPSEFRKRIIEKIEP